MLDAFTDGLRELGYVDGETISIEWRNADGKPDQTPRVAAELVALRPDVIATNFNPAAVALRDATSSIPVVFWNVADPVAAGIVADLARPGGNLTGIADIPSGGLYAKRLQLLRQAVPSLGRVALISFSGAGESAVLVSEVQSAARSMGVDIDLFEILTAGDVDTALVGIDRARVDAIYVMPSSIASMRHAQIARFAIENGLPTIHGGRAFVEAGGLMSYGSNPVDTYRRAATFIDRILKGARPADLPVEANTKFDLVINLTTARRLELTIPASVLAQAAEFIR